MPILRDATLCIQEAARCNERRPILEKQRAVNAHRKRAGLVILGQILKVPGALTPAGDLAENSVAPPGDTAFLVCHGRNHPSGLKLP